MATSSSLVAAYLFSTTDRMADAAFGRAMPRHHNVTATATTTTATTKPHSSQKWTNIGSSARKTMRKDVRGHASEFHVCVCNYYSIAPLLMWPVAGALLVTFCRCNSHKFTHTCTRRFLINCFDSAAKDAIRRGSSQARKSR